MLCSGHSHSNSGRRHLCWYAKVCRVCAESRKKKFSYREIKFLKINITSCSCPHNCRYTANSIPIPTVLPWLLSPFPRECCHCLHYCGNYSGITFVPIPMSLFSWHKLVEVDSECTLHISIVLAISMPRFIEFGGDLMKFWWKQVGSFLAHPVHTKRHVLLTALPSEEQHRPEVRLCVM